MRCKKSFIGILNSYTNAKMFMFSRSPSYPEHDIKQNPTMFGFNYASVLVIGEECTLQPPPSGISKQLTGSTAIYR